MAERKLYSVQPVRLCLPPRSHPSVPAHRRGSGRGSRRNRDDSGRGCHESLPVQDSGLSARLYGLQQLRQHLPRPDQGPRDEAARKPARKGRSRPLGIHAREGGLQGHRGRQDQDRQEQPVLPASIRILRRLRGLRRDALHQGHHAVVRSPDDYRQRHGMFVHLRRIGSFVALLHQRQGTGSRMGQLAVRRQRRIRSGYSQRGRKDA